MPATYLLPPMTQAGPWDRLTENEKAWIEFVRVIAFGCDPTIAPTRVWSVRGLLDAGPG